MRLLHTGADGRCAGSLSAYELDLEYGVGGSNDFELTVPAALDLPRGAMVWAPGTAIGGMVRDTSVRRSGGVVFRVLTGPTWTGLLNSKVIRPDAGQDHYTASGDLNGIIGRLISRLDLDGVLEAAPDCGVTVTGWQFERYCYGWDGIAKLLLAKGMRLAVERGGSGRTVVGAVPCRTFEDGGRWGFSLTRSVPVNHLLCLGKGELKDRTVVDLYADASGKVSRTQTLFGADEVCEVYDYPSAEAGELEEQGRKRLQEAQGSLSMDVSLPEGGEWDVGDLVRVHEQVTGTVAEARIERCVVTATSLDGGCPTQSFSCGEPEIKEA